MGVLTDEMQAAIRGERLAYVATVNVDGKPNVSPKGTTTVLDADHLVFADIASPRTVANLRERPATEVNVVDPVRRKGWRFAGEGRVVDGGAELETLLAFFRDRGVEIVRAGRPRVRCAVVIRVRQVHELISPAYDNGATEAEVARSWISFWRERLARFDANPLVGHDAWTNFAQPAGVVLAREDQRLSVEEFIKVVKRSGLIRPIDDTPRITGILANSNLVITARSGEDGTLIGVARCVTDFGYCCYLADLCVDAAWQRRGVGRALVAAVKGTVGPGCNVLLLSAPNAMTYYPRIRMERADNAFLVRRDG
jgi:predicted pyridoxine 5'-phosphate oxidase superfamily flavin-nucleotide-binding protein